MVATLVAFFAAGIGVAHAAPRKRVVVLDFDGPKADKFHDDLVRMVKKSYTLVPTDKWNGTADDLGATKPTDANVKKIAKKLKVDGIITGTIEKRRDEYLVHLKLRSGKTGTVSNKADTKSSGPRLDGKASTDVKDELLDAIDQLGVTPAKPDDNDDDADDDADAKPAPKKKPAGAKKPAATDDDDADAKPAPKKKPAAAGKKPASTDVDDDDVADGKKSGFGKKKPAGAKKPADDDDDDADAKPVATKKPATPPPPAKKKPADDDDAGRAPDSSHDDDDSPLKAAAAAKRPAKAPTSKKPPDDGSEDKSAPGGEEDSASPGAKVAAKTGDDDDDGGGVHKSSGEADGLVDPALALSPGRRAVDATLGLSLTQRTLGFTYLTSLTKPPPGYRGVPVAGAYLGGVIYPLAIGHKREGIAANLGVVFLYDQVLHVTSQVRYTDGTGAAAVAALPTSSSRYEFGVAFRHPFGTTATAPVLGAQLTYGGQNFLVAQTLPGGGAPDIPSVSYTILEPSVNLHLPVGAKLELIAKGGLQVISNAGQISQMDQYGQATVLGIDVEAGADYAIKKNLFVRASLRVETIGFSFTGNGMMTNNRDGDATTQDVFGARDTYIGGIVTIGYLY